MGSRLFWFLVGCAVGIVIGYIVRYLREIRDGVERVDKRIANDKGIVRYPLLYDVVLFLIVAMTVWAAFSSQRASNKVTDQQDKLTTQQTTISNQQVALNIEQKRLDKVVDCNNTFLQGTIAALNARTVFTVAQAQANVDLQKAFQKVVAASLAVPPPSDDEARKIVEAYATSLNTFINLTNKTSNQIEDNPYPTPKAFLECLTQR